MGQKSLNLCDVIHRQSPIIFIVLLCLSGLNMMEGIKCDNENQPRDFSVNSKDLAASTLVGLTCWENPILDPLAVLYLDNQLFVYIVNLSDFLEPQP